MNSNFTKVDTKYNELETELRAARFNSTTLADFLAVGINTDGTLKPAPEVVNARNSFLFGFTHSPDETYQLQALGKLRDQETWKARAASNSLKESLAYKDSFGMNKILNGAKYPSTGYPAWCVFNPAKFQVDGSITPLIMSIDGKIARIRTAKEVAVTGAPNATMFIYAEYQEDGVVVATTPESPTPPYPKGTAGTDESNYLTWHTDSEKNYPAMDVKPGDILRYKPSAPALLAGDYIIETVAPGSTPQSATVQIKGLFAQSGSNLAYEIRDPLAVTLGVSATETPTAGRIYIGEADLDPTGTAIIAVRPRHFGDTFVGAWLPVDVTALTGTPIFNAGLGLSWNHYLGSDKLDVTIQASTADDGSAPVEELHTVKLSATPTVTTGLGTLAIANALTVAATLGAPGNLATDYNAGPVDAHVHPMTGTPNVNLGGSIDITGAPSASLSGDVVPYSSVAVKYTRNQIWVKNVVPSSFFRDYDGFDRQKGFVRVIITKKG